MQSKSCFLLKQLFDMSQYLQKCQFSYEREIYCSLHNLLTFIKLNLKWSFLLPTIFGRQNGKWSELSCSSLVCRSLPVCLSLVLICRSFCLFQGFDNNGAIIGPRSTRHSNPEDHATHYFNTFSKEMLVQVATLFICCLCDFCMYGIKSWMKSTCTFLMDNVHGSTLLFFFVNEPSGVVYLTGQKLLLLY